MSQPRSQSMLEAVTNVVAGYALALAIQALVFPVMGLSVTPAQSLKIGAVFTLASIGRSYLLRRLFARFDQRGGPAPEAGT